MQLPSVVHALASMRMAKFVNVFTPKDKEQYVDECWDLLQAAYADVGGFHTARTREELIRDTFMWKLNARKGKIVALRMYRNMHGRKAVASATNGTAEGRAAIREIYSEDLSRAWGECSGPVEAVLLRLGGDKYIVPAEHARPCWARPWRLTRTGCTNIVSLTGTGTAKSSSGRHKGCSAEYGTLESRGRVELAYSGICSPTPARLDSRQNGADRETRTRVPRVEALCLACYTIPA